MTTPGRITPEPSRSQPIVQRAAPVSGVAIVLFIGFAAAVAAAIAFVLN